MTGLDIQTLQIQLQDKNPGQILKTALEHVDKIAISFSGAEDVVLIDMAVKLKRTIQVFSLDTGRLHPQTYRFIDRVRQHYQLEILICYIAPYIQLLQCHYYH